jgi:predicted TIM-barrel fold metal-dependent hydrolase
MYLPIDRYNDGLTSAAGWAIDTTKVELGWHGLIDSFERAVAANPRTIFIAAHYLAMSHDWPRLGAMMDKYPNLYVDISARIAESTATPRATRAFFIKYADRILFGTDNGMATEMYRRFFHSLESADEHIIRGVPGHYWPLSGLDLPDDVLEKVYRGNALRLFPDRKN